MLTKKQALYQVQLILDYLPEEEYNLIPEETIKYIEDNCEYDANIFIDPSIPLENQNIDSQTYKILDTILKSINGNIEKSNEEDPIKVENIRLKNLVAILQKENKKIKDAEKLATDYRKLVQQKDLEISNLKESNQKLYNYLIKIPKFIRYLFIKENINLLIGKGE